MKITGTFRKYDSNNCIVTQEFNLECDTNCGDSIDQFYAVADKIQAICRLPERFSQNKSGQPPQSDPPLSQTLSSQPRLLESDLGAV